NADVIEKMAKVNAVVFDKTGTVTHGQEPEVKFNGVLEDEELAWIKQLTAYSTHPLSKLINRSVKESSEAVVTDFKEIPGKGIEGRVNHHLIKLGSPIYIGAEDVQELSSRAFVSIDGQVRGYFSVKTSLRQHIGEMIRRLGARCAGLLSGDHAAGREQVRYLFPEHCDLLFNQHPEDKMNYIQALQQKGKKVMMVGDGLNDAGALTQSDVGIAVTDDTGVFTPASDGILKGEKI